MRLPSFVWGARKKEQERREKDGRAAKGALPPPPPPPAREGETERERRHPGRFRRLFLLDDVKGCNRRCVAHHVGALFCFFVLSGWTGRGGGERTQRGHTERVKSLKGTLPGFEQGVRINHPILWLRVARTAETSPAGMPAQLVEQQLRELSCSGREGKKLKGTHPAKTQNYLAAVWPAPQNGADSSSSHRLPGAHHARRPMSQPASTQHKGAGDGDGNVRVSGASKVPEWSSTIERNLLKTKDQITCLPISGNKSLIPSALPCGGAVNRQRPAKSEKQPGDSNENQPLKYK